MPIRAKNPAKSGLRPAISPVTAEPLPRPVRIVAKSPPGAGDVVAKPPASPKPVAAPKRAHHKVDRTTANWDENGDYIIGKGRPPKAHQWGKGQSGNPAGPKPRETPTPREAFRQTILQPFTIRVNGKEETVTMGEFAINALKANAAKGGRPTARDLLHFYRDEICAVIVDSRNGDEALTEQELQLIDTVLDTVGLGASPVVRKARDSGGEEDEL